MTAPLLLLLSALVPQATSPGPGEGGLRGGTQPADLAAPASDCISEIDHARLREQLAAHRARTAHATPPPVPGGAAAGSAPPFLSAYPQAGRWYGDLFTGNFVDLQGGGNVLDWECTDWTYDGHDATDTGLRTFDEQLIGVPVVAAWPGIVAATHDGEPDMNTVPMGQAANFVVLDHGGGLMTYYWHLKNGSVAVQVGEAVTAGTQLGLTASSGNSTGPHLHFAIYENGQLVEPHSGPCQPAPSRWEQQRPKPDHAYLLDFAFSRQSLNGVQPVFGMPRSNQVELGDPLIYFWAFVPALPPQSEWAVVFRRPDDTVAFDSGPVGFANNVQYRWSWWWWAYDIPDLHSIPGTWKVDLWVNGRRLISAPIEVVAQVDPAFNRAPEPVLASFHPPAPGPGDVVQCRIASHLALDDPDFDLVSYHYVWEVDGQVVRDVITAAHSDILAAGSVELGDTLTCTVTPTDGSLSGPSTQVSRVIDCTTPLDLEVEGRMNLFAAGHAVPDAPGGGGLGLPPLEIPLADTPGQIVTFDSISGLVSPGPAGSHGPDGGTLYGGVTDLPSWKGISGILHGSRTMFLCGVFLGSDEPADPAPARLDAGALAASVDIQPDLNQMFPIGDGLTGTGSGTSQRFHVPPGASRLLLGFADGSTFLIDHGWYDDNGGVLDVRMILPDPGSCCPVETYCSTSPNTVGPGALISHQGSPSIATNDLGLACAGLPPGQPGIFYYGPQEMLIAFGNGFRCVGGTLTRLAPIAADAQGSVLVPLDLSVPPQSTTIDAGSTWHFQFWYRDPAVGSGFNLSDGLRVTFCP